jgi:hypothetical protein
MVAGEEVCRRRRGQDLGFGWRGGADLGGAAGADLTLRRRTLEGWAVGAADVAGSGDGGVVGEEESGVEEESGRCATHPPYTALSGIQEDPPLCPPKVGPYSI